MLDDFSVGGASSFEVILRLGGWVLGLIFGVILIFFLAFYDAVFCVAMGISNSHISQKGFYVPLQVGFNEL